MAKESFAARWGKAGFEVTGIVFAVLLALWLEGWREDVERQERADNHLERIRAEVRQNHEGLIEAINDNQSYVDGLGAAITAEDLSLNIIAPYLQISGGSTTNSAWRSAQMTQSIGNMPIQTVTDLAALYDTQSYYANYLSAFFNQYTDLVIAAQDDEKKLVAVRTIRQHLMITNSLAQQAIDQYENFLGIQPSGQPDQSEQPIDGAR